jgi:hypothetical protein
LKLDTEMDKGLRVGLGHEFTSGQNAKTPTMTGTSAAGLALKILQD